MQVGSRFPVVLCHAFDHSGWLALRMRIPPALIEGVRQIARTPRRRSVPACRRRATSSAGVQTVDVERGEAGDVRRGDQGELVSGSEAVGGIPVRWVVPAGAARGTAIWLMHLGGSTEQTQSMLERLARRDFLAVSFDPPGHGRRGDGSPPWELARSVLASFRRRMWPLLGQTTLECLRVLDWADDRFGAEGPHVAGGVSMGGDVAVALAGIDDRIDRVSALVATPDWTRPGMHTVEDTPQLIDQGNADHYAQWFYDRLDPLTHLDAYERAVAVCFLCGGEDRHVPPDGALRFRSSLVERDASAADRIRVATYQGLSHLDGARDDRLYLDALDWLIPRS